ncbi:hypothetical protein [uncultured Bacteroides sp.]|uniref:helix-turn-helix transcriptional regulator n=1 Tax=uncultured Bacteroides sp. TaxID=162156 RepID=UPI002675132D|nr:hypothetical protein [uncultured Bacteroides sp.]
MLSENLEEKNIKLEERISEFIKLLDNRDVLNQDLVNRNRELKAKLNSHFAIISEFEEDELFLIIGLELLLLLKKRRYNQLRNEAHWLLLYAAINILYGDISDLLSPIGLTSQEMKVCYLTYIRLRNLEQSEILSLEVNTIKKYKNRIRNKLKIEENTQLSVYLSRFSRQNNK